MAENNLFLPSNCVLVLPTVKNEYEKTLTNPRE